MSVQSGDRYSFWTVWLITHLVMTVSLKGKKMVPTHFLTLHVSWYIFPKDFFSPSFPISSTFASICERVTPRLSHANSAVVLSAVKVLMKFMEMLPKDLDYYGTLLKKLAPPLVTLLSAEPELQYVALRNINLIVQRR